MKKDYEGLTEQEAMLFEEAEKMEQAGRREGQMPPAAGTVTGEDLKEKYRQSGMKVYLITSAVTMDDETEATFTFLFHKPKVASYDRYVKTISNSATKASRAFALDNIVEEQKELLLDTLEEYPAMSIGIANKLLKMLGLSDSIEVKKL